MYILKQIEGYNIFNVSIILLIFFFIYKQRLHSSNNFLSESLLALTAWESQWRVQNKKPLASNMSSKYNTLGGSTQEIAA